MAALLQCKFFERLPGQQLSPRGDIFDCATAEGTEGLNVVGNGKVSIPAHSDMIRTKLERVQNGDICVCWTTAPLLAAARPLLVAVFIVDTRQYSNSLYEISGPGLLGELQEYIAIAPVGQTSEVVTSARSLGTRVVNHPPPVDDTYEVLEAAYPPRGYNTQDTIVAGRKDILFLQATTAQESDTFTAVFPSGLAFTTVVTGVHERMFSIQIRDPLPEILPGGTKCYIHSTRMRVSDSSLLVEGGRLFYTNTLDGDPSDGKGEGTVGSLVIDRTEVGEGNEPDYIYSADPITGYILADSGVTQYQYTAPTTGDVELLLRQSTFNEWSLLRSVYAVTGTAYAPDSETVWDVLSAITDMSGYKVRRYFRGFSLGESAFFPLRRLEYFPVGHPVFTGEVTALGVDNKLAVNYGAILSLETEDTNQRITHLIPYGGGAGSGSFDFRTAAIGSVMVDYPSLDWGVVNNHYYIYDKTATGHASWTTETFGHISPLDPSNYLSRREAAEMLLRAACDWLMAKKTVDVTYSVEVFTIGEPRVGDVISLYFAGADPTAIAVVDGLPVISEVHHSVKDESGLRVTRLVINTQGALTKSGAKSTARALLDLQRGFRKANIGSRGDARITYDTMGFGGDATVQSQTGSMTFRSVTGDVYVVSEEGAIHLDSRAVNMSGPLSLAGGVRAADGVTMPDQARNYDWQVTIETVNGKPRAKTNYKPRPNT